MKITPSSVACGVVVAVLVMQATTSTTVRAQVGGPAQYQTVNVVDFSTGLPVGGAATLFRTHNSLSVRIATTGLDTSAAYTVWWIVWNDPALCSAPCGENDLGIAGNSVFYAAGFVTGTEGTVNVSTQLNAGHLPKGLDVLIPGGLQPGKGVGAEVHMIIRSHGPIIPGRVNEQIGSFLGACDVNTCSDQQAAAFPPVL